MIVAASILAAIAIALAAYAILRNRGEPSGWFAGPLIDGTNYSAGTVVGSDGSFAFPTADPGVHYVTKATGPLDPHATIRMRYRIDAAEGVEFLFVPDPTIRTRGPTLYIQRTDDDWSGEGKFETYRWFAEFAAQSPIVAGEYAIEAPLTDARWKAIEKSTAADHAQDFAATLADPARVGFVFGSIDGAGHGIRATGVAKFTLLEFTIGT